MEATLTRLEMAVKNITLAYIATDKDMVVNADILPQPINKAWLEQLDVIITKPFGDLI